VIVRDDFWSLDYRLSNLCCIMQENLNECLGRKVFMGCNPGSKFHDMFDIACSFVLE